MSVEPLQPDLGDVSVLVVDDEPALRFPIAEMLRDVGITVWEAGNADEALERLSDHQPIGVVFSDVRMPGSMDGLQLARKIEAEYDGVVVMLTSGNAAGQLDRRVIEKPYSLSLVVDQILAALSGLKN